MRYWPSVGSRWLDIDRGLFLWTETKSRSVKTYPAFLAEPAWLKKNDLIWQKDKALLRMKNDLC